MTGPSTIRTGWTLCAAAALALGGCEQRGSEPRPELLETTAASGDGASEAGTEDRTARPAGSPSQGGSQPAPRPGNDADEPPGPPPPPAVPPVVNTSIPPALHGRWGLAPGDCTSERGDAKGLIVVSVDKIRFYESTARLVKLTERMPDRIQGDFAFSGEGMTWTRHMRWTVSGDKLQRFEGEGDTALTYTRC